MIEYSLVGSNDNWNQKKLIIHLYIYLNLCLFFIIYQNWQLDFNDQVFENYFPFHILATMQKRLKKEKKAKKKLQEALEFESKCREQVEQALKQATTSDSGLRMLKGNM